MMRVLLCAPWLEDLVSTTETGHIRTCPNLGLYLLAAVAIEAGHQVRVVDPVDYEKAFGSEEAVKASVSDADILGVSVNSCTWPKARRLLLSLEEMDSRPVTVLGGPHASILDEHVLRAAPVDFVVRGEAEKSFPLLLESLWRDRGASGIPGISYLEGDELVRTAAGPLLTAREMSELPPPAFDLMPDGYYDLIPVESSRGCYHACVFCSISFRRNWRGVSPEEFSLRLSRQEHLLRKTRRNSFFIIDDCFTADHERLRGIADRLSSFPHRLNFEARITDLIAEGMMDAIKALPLQVMEMGVECGYDEGLKRVGKKLTIREVNEAAGLIRENGLEKSSRFSFIMGLPWETRKEVLDTLEFAFKLTGRMGARLQASWLTVFPGSIIWRKRRDWRIEIGEPDYDTDRWWREKDIFKRAHPGLDPEKDVQATLDYVRMMMKLFPDIVHDGFFKDLPGN